MAKHDVRVKLHAAEIPVGRVDLELPVRIDGKLRGRLEISNGSLDWKPRGRKPVRLTWEEFAELIEEHGKRVK